MMAGQQKPSFILGARECKVVVLDLNLVATAKLRLLLSPD